MVMLVVALFYIAQSQIWNTYNLWVRDHIDLRFGAWTMPVPWLQSFDGLAPVVSMPLLLMFWRWQAGRASEPNEFTKMAIGCFIFSAATLWLAGAEFVTSGDGRAPLLWAVFFHLISNLGWLFFVPTSIAVFARVAPKQVSATMISLFYFGVFIGSVVSGRLGGLYEQLPASQFWALHAAVVGSGGVLILIIAATMRRAFAAPAQETALAA
jgi:POT family proton-dependent oligopeptide transporter